MSEAEAALKNYQEAEAKLKALAKRQFARGSCPLAHNHYDLSNKLWGTGCIWWECEFCGEEHSI